MKMSRVLSIARDMENAGMRVFIIKNTVYDLLQHKETDCLQLVVSVGLAKVEEYCKQHGYKTEKIKDDVLTCSIEGTTTQIMTLKYMTCDEFLAKIVPTDWSANTLLMNTEEKIMDLHDGINAIRERKLVPVPGFDIKTAPFLSGLYLDTLMKVYSDGFTGEGDLNKDVFAYIQKHAQQLTAEQKTLAAEIFFIYCCHADTSGEMKKNFISIPSFYSGAVTQGSANTASQKPISEKGVEMLMKMDGNLFLVALAYLYNIRRDVVAANSDLLHSPEYEAVMAYAGKDLKNESLYDRAMDEYGFDTLDTVVKIQRLVSAMKGEAYTLPRFHHKSVFSEIDERYPWKTCDVNVELPKEDDFSKSFDSIAELLKEVPDFPEVKGGEKEPRKGSAPAPFSTDYVPPVRKWTEEPVQKAVDTNKEKPEEKPFANEHAEAPKPVLDIPKAQPKEEILSTPVKDKNAGEATVKDAKEEKEVFPSFEQMMSQSSTRDNKTSHTETYSVHTSQEMEDISSISSVPPVTPASHKHTDPGTAQSVTEKFRRIVLGQQNQE